MQAIGTHILAEFYGVNPGLISEVAEVQKRLEQVVKKGKFNVLHSRFHQFEPQGVTAFYLLAESHVSIHTWPEHGYFAVDLFTCGKEGNAHIGFDELVKQFPAEKVEKTVKVRGSEEN